MHTLPGPTCGDPKHGAGGCGVGPAPPGGDSAQGPRTYPAREQTGQGREGGSLGPLTCGCHQRCAVPASQEGPPLGASRDRKAHASSQPGPPGSSQVARAVRPGHWSRPQWRPALPGRGPVSSLTFLLLICIGSPRSAFRSWEGRSCLRGNGGMQDPEAPRPPLGCSALGRLWEEGGWQGHPFAEPRGAAHSLGPGFRSWP